MTKSRRERKRAAAEVVFLRRAFMMLAVEGYLVAAFWKEQSCACCFACPAV